MDFLSNPGIIPAHNQDAAQPFGCGSLANPFLLKPPRRSAMLPPRSALLRFTLSACLLSGGFLASSRAQTTSAPYSQIIVFGDSLSDTGNFAATTEDDFDLRYPGSDFNYADGRFTDSTSTDPSATLYTGVWHEQLATLFLGMKAANPSLDGGTDYAFGDAETTDGQRDINITTGVDIHVDNLNRQVSTYLDNHTGDPAALYIVWAGSNDLFVDDSASNVTAAAANVTAVVQRLAQAGAATFIVPNVPPLGLTPEYSGDATMSAALNQAASSFSDQLNTNLDALEASLASSGLKVKIYRLDIFGLFNRLTASGGAAYGFTNITESAQGASVNADQNLFWDSVHPTTYGHFQIAAEAYTLLTGQPIVEVSPIPDDSGFYLTRTGSDTSAKLKVYYTLAGGAVNGVDYSPLFGQAKLKPGQQTATITVTPAGTAAAGKKVKLVLTPATNFTLPVEKKAKIKLP